MFTNSFEKQLDKTIKISMKYNTEREKLKNMFCDEFDNIAITTLLQSLITKGHPSEKQFASSFKEHYQSDNYDEKEICEFKRLYEKYKEDVVNSLENSGE